MAVEHAPDAAGLQVYDQQGALGPRIRDVGGAAVGMETHVVQIAALGRQLHVEADRPHAAVGGEVDLHQLRPALDHLLLTGRGGVEHPEPAASVADHRLDADEPVFRRQLVLAGVAPFVPAFVRIGPQRAVHHLGDGDRRILGPAGEVDEDPALFADRDPGHLVLELRDHGKLCGHGVSLSVAPGETFRARDCSCGALPSKRSPWPACSPRSRSADCR